MLSRTKNKFFRSDRAERSLQSSQIFYSKLFPNILRPINNLLMELTIKMHAIMYHRSKNSICPRSFLQYIFNSTLHMSTYGSGDERHGMRL